MTRKQLEAWLAQNRPDLALDVVNHNKCFRKVAAGNRGYHGGFKTWTAVAIAVGALEPDV